MNNLATRLAITAVCAVGLSSSAFAALPSMESIAIARCPRSISEPPPTARRTASPRFPSVTTTPNHRAIPVPGRSPENVGRSAMFDPDAATQAGLDPAGFIYASYLIRARLKPGEADPAFILEYLRTLAGRKQLREASNTSAGQYNINIEGLRSFRIPAAKIASQRAFAVRLGAARALRAAMQRSLAQVDELFASLQAQAFSGQL